MGEDNKEYIGAQTFGGSTMLGFVQASQWNVRHECSPIPVSQVAFSAAQRLSEHLPQLPSSRPSPGKSRSPFSQFKGKRQFGRGFKKPTTGFKPIHSMPTASPSRNLTDPPVSGPMSKQRGISQFEWGFKNPASSMIMHPGATNPCAPPSTESATTLPWHSSTPSRGQTSYFVEKGPLGFKNPTTGSMTTHAVAPTLNFPMTTESAARNPTPLLVSGPKLPQETISHFVENKPSNMGFKQTTSGSMAVLPQDTSTPDTPAPCDEFMEFESASWECLDHAVREADAILDAELLQGMLDDW